MKLVSCICITQNRRFFLRQAIEQWKRALCTHIPTKSEFVILDGSEKSSAHLLYPLKGVRYFHEPSEPHSGTGKAHNRACELAEGEIIIQWDDDDWQSPDRIVKQVAALEAHPEGAFAFTSQFWWYHLAERRAAKAISWQHGGSAGATFAYHRKVWEQQRFREVEQGEDSFFWQDHETRGTPMLDMKDPSLLIYIRHNRNGSHATNLDFTDEDTSRARETMATDLDFYNELSEILPLDQWNNPHARWAQQRAQQHDRGVFPWQLRRR
jgi:glycosyltransferase involved in cell wall biosynthesis